MSVLTDIEGLELTGDPVPSAANNPTFPDLAISLGRKLVYIGQTVNKVTGLIANQAIGVALLTSNGGTVTAGTTGTVVVTNSKIGANSIVILTAVNEVSAGTFQGDTTAGRGMTVWVEAIASGSMTLGYRPTANMAADWSCNYLIHN
jgi:hypothetical protein